MLKTDKEKSENLSCRFRRMNLIRSLKNFAIQNQDYEFAANLRDIERDLEKEHDFDNEATTLDDIFIRLNNIHDKLRNDNSKSFLKSYIREYKIGQILKNPLD